MCSWNNLQIIDEHHTGPVSLFRERFSYIAEIRKGFQKDPFIDA